MNHDPGTIFVTTIRHAFVKCAECKREEDEMYADEHIGARRFALMGWENTGRGWVCPKCQEET